jgi:MtN3 and saliva related transmembrane protein
LEDIVYFADVIGIIAGILVLSSFIPQLHKAYKTKRMSDVSIYLMGLIASGMLLWVVYGIIRRDPVIIGTNATGFVLNIILMILKLKYDKLHQ